MYFIFGLIFIISLVVVFFIGKNTAVVRENNNTRQRYTYVSHAHYMDNSYSENGRPSTKAVYLDNRKGRVEYDILYNCGYLTEIQVKEMLKFKK